MTRPSTSEALGGLVKALEAVRDADDAESEYLLALATVKARAALTSWRERLPLREDGDLQMMLIEYAEDREEANRLIGAAGRDARSKLLRETLDALDRSLFSETPPVKEET